MHRQIEYDHEAAAKRDQALLQAHKLLQYAESLGQSAQICGADLSTEIWQKINDYVDNPQQLRPVCRMLYFMNIPRFVRYVPRISKSMPHYVNHFGDIRTKATNICIKNPSRKTQISAKEVHRFLHAVSKTHTQIIVDFADLPYGPIDSKLPAICVDGLQLCKCWPPKGMIDNKSVNSLFITVSSFVRYFPMDDNNKYYKTIAINDQAKPGRDYDAGEKYLVGHPVTLDQQLQKYNQDISVIIIYNSKNYGPNLDLTNSIWRNTRKPTINHASKIYIMAEDFWVFTKHINFTGHLVVMTAKTDTGECVPGWESFSVGLIVNKCQNSGTYYTMRAFMPNGDPFSGTVETDNITYEPLRELLAICNGSVRSYTGTKLKVKTRHFK